MPPNKLFLEIWKSDKDREERHYFTSKECQTYFFGYNPDLISEEKIKKIKEILEIYE